MTNEADRQALLRIARDAVVAAASGRDAAAIQPAGALADPAAVFVTLYDRGELRGCIGRLEADRSIAEAVVQCAVSAARADPRFPPVTTAELPHISIELSILGPLEQIGSIDEIEVGRHGLLVEHGRRRGLLLPQVAIEWRWEREAFLAQTCHKAGLARDAWRHGARIWKFEAEVFGE
jgi:AmmeMemoRadiSam system protein A